MRYVVRLTARAKHEITTASAYIERDSPMNAARWLAAVDGALASLADLPLRCPVARESPLGERELRQLLSGGYRLIFYIEGSKVVVVHVRHGSRDRAELHDLEE